MRILITGGAGYVGSHVVKALANLGHKITIYDNLSSGHREAVTQGELVLAELADVSVLEKLFAERRFDAVMHFAGHIMVPESITQPLKYYENNTFNSYRLLRLCEAFDVNKFIFSSTAAVYGTPVDGICREGSELLPINPYGHSKAMVEAMLRDLSRSSKLKFVALRYFNVSGADPEGRIGQSFPKPFHLINVACEAACGKREKIDVFGTDYETPDGTCIRDYIHVTDLADAHVKALQYLEQGGQSESLNCGYGHGFSVKEVIEKVREVTKTSFKVNITGRRPGDPPVLVAEAKRIHQVIGWRPRFDDLGFIIKTAYEWEKNRTY